MLRASMVALAGAGRVALVARSRIPPKAAIQVVRRPSVACLG